MYIAISTNIASCSIKCLKSVRVCIHNTYGIHGGKCDGNSWDAIYIYVTSTSHVLFWPVHERSTNWPDTLRRKTRQMELRPVAVTNMYGWVLPHRRTSLPALFCFKYGTIHIDSSTSSFDGPWLRKVLKSFARVQSECTRISRHDQDVVPLSPVELERSAFYRFVEQL